MDPDNFSNQISTAGGGKKKKQLFLSLFFPSLSHSKNITWNPNSLHISVLCGSFTPCHFSVWVFSMTWESKRLHLHGSPSFPKDFCVSLLISSSFWRSFYVWLKKKKTKSVCMEFELKLFWNIKIVSSSECNSYPCFYFYLQSFFLNVNFFFFF